MTTPLTKKDSRKEQAPRAQGSPASGERSEPQDERPKPIPGKWTAHQSENPAYPHEWDVYEGGPRGYSVIGDGFITESQAKEIALRHNLTIPPRGQQQEWTEDRVEQILENHGAKGVAKVHNAELATEREKSNDFKRYKDSYIESLEHRLHIERQDHNGLRDICKAQLESLSAEREKLAEHIKAANEVTDENIELEQQLAAERQRSNDATELLVSETKRLSEVVATERQRSKQELHQLAIYLEGNCYSDPDFMHDSRALKAAVTLRGQLLSALAEIEKKHSALYDLLKGRNKTSEANALKALDYTNLDALHKHDAKVRKPLVEALEKIATTPLSCYCGHIAHDALAKVKEQ